MNPQDKFTELKTTAKARSSHTSALATQRQSDRARGDVEVIVDSGASTG